MPNTRELSSVFSMFPNDSMVLAFSPPPDNGVLGSAETGSVPAPSQKTMNEMSGSAATAAAISAGVVVILPDSSVARVTVMSYPPASFSALVSANEAPFVPGSTYSIV